MVGGASEAETPKAIATPVPVSQRLVLLERILLLQVLELHPATRFDALAGIVDPAQKPWIVLEAVIEPVVLGLEADEYAGRPSMARNHNLTVFRLSKKTREVVLHLGQRHFFHAGLPNWLSHFSASALGTMAKTSTVEPATS